MEIFVVDLIKSVGFPIFVAVYMMVVMKKSLDKNTEAVQDLKKCIMQLYKKED